MRDKNTIEILSDYILVDGFHLAPDIFRSNGAWIVDKETNRRYLDCYDNFSSLAVGHNHLKMVTDLAFRQKIVYAEMENPANSDVYAPEYAEFVETFAKIAKPGHFKYLFFIDGGGPAVDNALKTAFDWKAGKNPLGTSSKYLQIIHFDRAFHGRTGYALSVTRTDSVKTRHFPRFDWPWFHNPYLRFPVDTQEIKRVRIEEKTVIDNIEITIKNCPRHIAAIIIEPIQGEGGDNHFRGEFLAELRRVTLENDVLLIFDEVQTGFGTTGKMWCYEHFGVEPDILVFGKKSQVCGIMVSDRINEVKDNVFKISGRINSTIGGSLVHMVKCKKILEIMQEDNLVANAAETGEYFLERLNNLAVNSGGIISNARGRGFFLAFDLPTAKTRDRFTKLLWSERLAHLKCGEKSIRFRPPLIFNKKNVNVAIEMIVNVAKLI